MNASIARIVAVNLALFQFSACSGDSNSEDDTCTGAECRPERDTTSDSNADAPEIDGDADASGCVPGAASCIDPTTAGICLEDGQTYRELPCSAGERCDAGDCVPGDPGICIPGTIDGCGTPSALRRCSADGTRYDNEACPEAAPFCANGVCENQMCTPGEERCRGNEVVVCSADGLELTSVEVCPEACRSGECVEADPCTFDGKNYLGCDFWAVYLDNEARGLSFGLTISNPGTRSVAAEVIGPGDARIWSGTVPRDTLVPVDLSSVTQINGTSLSDAAYRVRADGPVTVHQFNPPNNLVQGYSNDASLLLPTNALGTQYRVMAYYSGDDLATFARLSARWYVTVVNAAAVVNDVEITTPAAIAAGGGVAEMSPEETRTFSLQPGQVLNLMAKENNGDDPDPGDPADLTGMLISAQQPVVVFSGSEASYIPDDTGAADHLEQQLYPIDTWGSEYVISKFAPRGQEDDVYRIMTNTPGTVLSTIPPIDGVNGRTLNNAGDAVEFIYRGNFVVSANAPISVGQFMVGSLYPGFGSSCSGTITSGCVIPLAPECANAKRIGDPAFLLPVPTPQFRADYTFLTPEGYVTNWISLMVRTGTEVVLDGAAVAATAVPIASTPWSVINVNVEPGVHSVESSEPFGLSVYGYGCDVSYAYPGGLNLDSL